MAKKGKAVTIESDVEEEDLQALIAQIEAQDNEVEDVSPMPSKTRLPTYVPLWKGTTKILKDLKATKSALQTPLLLNGIMFEGMHLG